MNKELLLLRHGKSDWNTNTTDFNRPLKKRGKSNTQQIAEWLVDQKLVPNLIISSPAKRALTTSHIICEIMGIPTQTIQLEETIYEASSADLRQILLHIPDSIQRLLLVGHNPGLENLLRDFVDNIRIPDDEKLIPTATIAYLQLDQQWSTYQGNLLIQRPKELAIRNNNLAAASGVRI